MRNPRVVRLTRNIFRIEKHPLGPRCYLLGQRVHEVWLGIAILAALLGGALAGKVDDGYGATLAVTAALWLIAKDWRDLFPAKRDTASWQLGVHRTAHPWRPVRHLESLPLLSACAAFFVAVVNAASALTPNVHWREHLLVRWLPGWPIPVLHAIALPAAVLLSVAAFYLAKRRQRAWQCAFGLLVALGVLNILKGLDVEEAVLSFAVAGLLWAGRRSFHVRHDPISVRSVVWRVPLLVCGLILATALATLVAAPDSVSVLTVLRESFDLALWQKGPIHFGDELRRLPLAIELLTTAVAAWSVYLLFRPLAAPRSLPDPEVRALAGELVRRYGSDTLAYFKLRRDKHYLFSSDHKAFAGYRIQGRTLMISGDPVGEETSFEDLLRTIAAFAAERGLRLAVMGSSEPLLGYYTKLGLRAFYLGDEAIVATDSFSLQGRQIRKVRQSLSRIEKEGYSLQLLEAAEIGDMTDELETVSAAWRGGQAERGFSMALDTVSADEYRDTLLLTARDSEGTLRGYLHFVPSYGRQALSLSMMRRHPDTPNGLTEAMIARAIVLCKERGIEELSLNFAAFARLLTAPRTRRERLLGWVVRRFNPYFQIESLYRFNAKFFPRWEPRYLLYEGSLGLPRAALAAAWLEGQLPRPWAGLTRRDA